MPTLMTYLGVRRFVDGSPSLAFVDGSRLCGGTETVRGRNPARTIAAWADSRPARTSARSSAASALPASASLRRRRSAADSALPVGAGSACTLSNLFCASSERRSPPCGFCSAWSATNFVYIVNEVCPLSFPTFGADETRFRLSARGYNAPLCIPAPGAMGSPVRGTTLTGVPFDFVIEVFP